MWSIIWKDEIYLFTNKKVSKYPLLDKLLNIQLMKIIEQYKQR